jgi:hypothetical protein
MQNFCKTVKTKSCLNFLKSTESFMTFNKISFIILKKQVSYIKLLEIDKESIKLKKFKTSCFHSIIFF